MKLSLLQKVLISAQTLYGYNVEKFTATILYAEFINNDFFTPEKNGEQAMTRRLNELCAMGLVEICSKLDSRSVYRLTRYGKTIDAKKVHVGVTLVMREPNTKEYDMPKRLKKEKSDRIRSVQAESQIKSENKVLNIENAFKGDHFEIAPGVAEYRALERQKKISPVVTDTLHPMSEKPKHTLRQHILSLFGL